MTRTHYRLTVILCTLAWFMAGLHAPALHELTHEGRATPWLVLAFLVAFVIAGCWGLLLLLGSKAAPRFPDSRGT